MIKVRDLKTIYQIDGEIDKGNFHGRWHFAFGDYHDSKFEDLGTLRVFNDDTPDARRCLAAPPPPGQ